jgi:hypothetical protein
MKAAAWEDSTPCGSGSRESFAAASSRAAASDRRQSAARTIERLFTELDLAPRVPAPLMADAAVAFIDGLALDVANGSAREPRVSYDIFWLALLGLTE